MKKLLPLLAVFTLFCLSVPSCVSPEGDILRTILRTGHTRFPVHDNADILGSVHAKDLFKLMGSKTPLSIKSILRPPYFISAEKKIDAQLRSFRTKKVHQAVVLDYSGEVVGLVTMEDIIEELVGAIHDEHDEE